MTTHSLVVTAIVHDGLLREIAVVGCAAGCAGFAILTLAAQVKHR